MKFKILLFILLKKLQKATKKNETFIKFIQSKTLKVTIKTMDNKNGRQYIFDRGKISSHPGAQHDSDTSMVWSDAAIGFKVMSSTNEEAALAALTENKLQIEGNFKEFAWFSRALNIMMGKA